MHKDHKLFVQKTYYDDRGYFFESFSKNINHSLEEIFYQDNMSFSKKGTIRGLHYQWNKPMGKLVQAVTGKIIDHIVDIRLGSPTLGKHWSFELSEENKNVLWVPPGYAHGFEALEDSHVMYKCSSYYNPEGESAINIFDEELNIPLSLDKKDVIMSEKDKSAQSYAKYVSKPRFVI
jgi:dTDP-4-dehydrorhamnose 3,5-epimerase